MSLKAEFKEGCKAALNGRFKGVFEMGFTVAFLMLFMVGVKGCVLR